MNIGSWTGPWGRFKSEARALVVWMEVTDQQERIMHKYFEKNKVFARGGRRGRALTEHLATILKVRAGPVDVDDMASNKNKQPPQTKLKPWSYPMNTGRQLRKDR